MLSPGAKSTPRPASAAVQAMEPDEAVLRAFYAENRERHVSAVAISLPASI